MCSLQRVLWSQWGKRCCMIGSIDRQPQGGLIHPLLSQAIQRKIYIFTYSRIPCERIHWPFLDWTFFSLLSIRLWRSISHHILTLSESACHSPDTQDRWHPLPLQKEIISSKALGLKVSALRFWSGFLVAVAAQSGETRWRFGPGRLGSTVIALGCVSKWERKTRKKWTLNEHL